MVRETYTDESIEQVRAALTALPEQQLPRGRKQVVQAVRDEIKALREQGYTYEQIAAAFAGGGVEIAVPTLKEYLRLSERPASKRRTRKASKKSPAAAVASPAPAVQPDPGPADAHTRPASSVEPAPGPGDEDAAALVEVAGPAPDAPSGGDHPGMGQGAAPASTEVDSGDRSDSRPQRRRRSLTDDASPETQAYMDKKKELLGEEQHASENNGPTT